ncbi:hypothetical protein BFP72_06555 [Reichenbachiella sp. 5M10]|nr:hypothetical protein BFP72_06555 [Reichenbachiella sp. 5M10]
MRIIYFHILSLSLALCLCLSATLAMSQRQETGGISGAVSSSDGEALPMVPIRILETGVGVVADDQGHFVFSDLPFGEYRLSVTFLGFEDRQITVTLDDQHPHVSLNLTLTHDSEMLEEVTISHDAEKEQQTQGFAVEAVGTKQFQAQSIEINQVLDQTAGVKVRQSGGLGSRVNYSMNGLSGQSIRFFMDGVPMDYFGSSYSINTIPISLVDRVEVYKGVVPVELGNDALGGAINLVTKSSFNEFVEASYSYGSFNTHRAAIQGSWRAKQSGLTMKLSAFYNYSDNNYYVWGEDVPVTDVNTANVTRGEKVRRFHDGYESKSVKADFGFTQKKWADKLLLGVLYSEMDKDIQHGPTMEVVFGEARYHQRVVMPNMTYQKFDFLAKGLDVNWFASYSYLVRDRIDTTTNMYNWDGSILDANSDRGEQLWTLNTLDQKVWLNRLNLVYQLNPHHKLGYNYVFSDLTRTDSDPVVTQKTDGYWAPQTFRRHSMGWVLQSQFLEQRLHTSLFVKWFGYRAAIKTATTENSVTSYQTEQASASDWGYGVAGSYQLRPSVMLSLSVEQAYRLPAANEVLGDGLNVVSTTALRSESSLNANLGFRVTTAMERKNRFTFSGNVFYRDVTDLIQQYSYDPGAFVNINFDQVRMQGVDGKIKFAHSHWLTVNQTVSYLSPIVKSDTDELGNNNVTKNSRLANTPFFQTNTELRTQFKNLIQEGAVTFFYWSVSYVGEFHRHSEIIGRYNKDVIPAQLVNSCGIGYTFPKEKLSLSVDVSNLFDEQVFDNYAIQKPGRAAYIKATYRLL